MSQVVTTGSLWTRRFTLNYMQNAGKDVVLPVGELALVDVTNTAKQKGGVFDYYVTGTGDKLSDIVSKIQPLGGKIKVAGETDIKRLFDDTIEEDDNVLYYEDYTFEG